MENPSDPDIMSDEKTYFTIGLDDGPTELLMDLAEETGQPPKLLLESIVRDVLIDDAHAHGIPLAPEDRRLLN